jgi:peroxiredoxin (alkyl hydroperoxide reductase subunit C)
MISPSSGDFWPHGKVAQDYGVFNDKSGTANRGTFLVDTDGVIRFAEMYGPGEARDQTAWKQALSALPT